MKYRAKLSRSVPRREVAPSLWGAWDVPFLRLEDYSTSNARAGCLHSRSSLVPASCSTQLCRQHVERVFTVCATVAALASVAKREEVTKLTDKLLTRKCSRFH